MNSTGPSKKVHIKRNFTLAVSRCMGVIIPGDFKGVHIKRDVALNVFVLTRFHCMLQAKAPQRANCVLHLLNCRRGEPHSTSLSFHIHQLLH